MPISVGGSRIEEWTTGGARHRRLQIAIRRAIDYELAFTHVLWHQGEKTPLRPDLRKSIIIEIVLRSDAVFGAGDAPARTLINGGTFGATRQSRRQPYQFAHFGMQATITFTATFGRAGRKVTWLSES
jgi:hypothetical protein